MIYEQLRHFADSWGLLAMAAIYLAFIGWTFRPSARGHHRDAAEMIFKDEQSGRTESKASAQDVGGQNG